MLGLGTAVNRGGFVSATDPLLLDEYSGAAAAYSLRKLSNSYSGNCVTVRRDSDNLDANIGFSGGVLDTSALASHCGSANGFVAAWFDQSGNSNNATQLTASDQPKIYDGTTGNINELLFTGSEFLTLTPISINLGLGFSAFNKRRNSSTGNKRVFIQTTSGGSDHSTGGTLLATKEFIVDGDPKVINVTANTGDLLSTYILTPNSGDYYINGTLQATDSHSKTNTINPTLAQISRSSGFQGGINELIIYNSDQSSNRTAIESNINTFYSIY